MRKVDDPPAPGVDATDVVHDVLVLVLELELAVEAELLEEDDDDEVDAADEEVDEEEELVEVPALEPLEAEELADELGVERLEEPVLPPWPAIATK